MKLKIIFLLFVTLSGIMPTAGVWAQEVKPAAIEEKQGYSDPTKPVVVKTGGEFRIILSSNPTTGYGWQLAIPLEGSIIKSLGSEYIAGQPVLAGSGGNEIWRFKATGQGRALISFQYLRSWEKNTPPVRTHTFTVIVE